MPTDEDIIKASAPAIESFAEIYTVRLQDNISRVFKEEALPTLKAAYLEVYDRLASIVEGLYPPRIQGKDPLSLVAQRPLFVAQLDRELSKASFDGSEFVVTLKLTGDEDAEGRPRTPDSLNYYIEGSIGEAAFITPEHLEQRRPTSQASRGRVGKGFIISRQNYIKERWEEFTGISFSEVRHPVSGFRPFGDFDRVPESIDFGTFVRKALEITNSQLDRVAV